MHIFKLNLTGSQRTKFYPNCDHLILAIHIKYMWLCSLKHNLVSVLKKNETDVIETFIK